MRLFRRPIPSRNDHKTVTARGPERSDGCEALPVLGTQCCSDAFFSSEGGAPACPRGSHMPKNRSGTVYRWTIGGERVRCAGASRGIRRMCSFQKKKSCPEQFVLRLRIYGTHRASLRRDRGVRRLRRWWQSPQRKSSPTERGGLSMVRCLSGRRRRKST